MAIIHSCGCAFEHTAVKQLRVTTFNMLAPVWVSPSIYPSMNMEEFESSRRRERQLEGILRLDSDVLFLQECQKTELDQLLEARGSMLRDKYDVHFCSNPLTFWSNWLTEFGSQMQPKLFGVCILTKKSKVVTLNVQEVPIDHAEWKSVMPEYALGARACVATVRIHGWKDEDVLLVTSHLDADSAHRAGLQGRQLAERLLGEATLRKAGAVIWGGDFNMENRSRHCRAISRKGFQLASGALTQPTVLAIAGTVRVDHIFVRPGNMQSIRAIDTEIPVCPIGHSIPILPGLSELQWLACALLGEMGAFMRLLAILLLPLCMAFFFLPVLVYRIDRKKQCLRLSWALDTWGSDHLPVTVTLDMQGMHGIADKSPRKHYGGGRLRLTRLRSARTYIRICLLFAVSFFLSCCMRCL